MDRNRGRLPHAPPPGQGRGPAGGYLIRLQRVRRYPSRPGDRGPRRERDHRHHPLRQRGEISQRKVLGPGMIRVEPEPRSEEHTSELQSLRHLVCRLLLVISALSTLFPYTTLFRSTIVTILCDSAEKYLSEKFWDQE